MLAWCSFPNTALNNIFFCNQIWVRDNLCVRIKGVISWWFPPKGDSHPKGNFCIVLYSLQSLSQAACSAYNLSKVSQEKQNYISKSFRTGKDFISSYWFYGTVSYFLMTKSGRFSLSINPDRQVALKNKEKTCFYSSLHTARSITSKLEEQKQSVKFMISINNQIKTSIFIRQHIESQMYWKVLTITELSTSA